MQPNVSTQSRHHLDKVSSSIHLEMALSPFTEIHVCQLPNAESVLKASCIGTALVALCLFLIQVLLFHTSCCWPGVLVDGLSSPLQLTHIYRPKHENQSLKGHDTCSPSRIGGAQLYQVLSSAS